MKTPALSLPRTGTHPTVHCSWARRRRGRTTRRGSPIPPSRSGTWGPYTGEASSFSALKLRAGGLLPLHQQSGWASTAGSSRSSPPTMRARRPRASARGQESLIYPGTRLFMVLVTPCSGRGHGHQSRPFSRTGCRGSASPPNPKLTTPTVAQHVPRHVHGRLLGERAMAGVRRSPGRTRRKVVLVAHTNDWARGLL